MKRPEEKLEDHLGLFSSLSEQELAAAEERASHRFRSAPISATTAPFAHEVVVRPMWRWRASLAAIAAAAILVVVFMQTHRTDARAVVESGGGARKIEYGEVVQGTKGAGDTVVLSDGSRVEMRGGAELVLERADDGVRIRLNKGDVIVNAAKQHGHLYVQTKDVTVSVVGTVFLVKAEEAGSRVAVIEGEVQVKKGAAAQKLLPGEQAATDALMESRPLSEEISWSRYVSAHLALLRQSASPAGTKPGPAQEVFDVVSIREHPSAGAGGRGGPGGSVPACGGDIDMDKGRVLYRNYTLYRLITEAYGKNCYTWEQFETEPLSGGPGWIKSDSFDVEAVIPPGPAEYVVNTRGGASWVEDTGPRVRRMLQAVLSDRFKLVLRRETKELPAYVLTVAKGGPKLEPWKDGDRISAPSFGFRQIEGQLVAGVFGGKASFAGLATSLEIATRRPVVDRTGIVGEFNYLVDFAPPHPEGNSLHVMSSPSIFDALRTQLGLELTASKEKVEVLVIEHVEKPSRN